ncbi:hypothetical protein NHP164001_08960 [Helicobacter trogontum]|uniref:Uncharacterized protein n=1 Tax=Helicobacter trogontum TaxID=50960 RepID=A0ABQ0D3F4_9HELI
MSNHVLTQSYPHTIFCDTRCCAAQLYTLNIRNRLCISKINFTGYNIATSIK